MPAKNLINKVFKNILIARTDRIGDVVLTTPAIKALRKAYPKARLSILVTPVTFDLVNGNPYLDAVMVDDRQDRHKGLFGFLRLAKELRSKQFDLSIVFHTKRRYNLLMALAGIPCRLGYKNNKFGFLLTHPLKDQRHLGQKHESQYCLDVLGAIGVEARDPDVFVPVQKEAEGRMAGWMQEHGLGSNEFIAVHPGASDPAKCWSSANFAGLIDALIERYGLKIVMIGSGQTIQTAREIIGQSRHKENILDMTGKTTLAQTVSLLRRARLLISNDSGPVHVAAGVGTSVIALFMRSLPGINAGRWKPLGEKSFAVDNKQKPGEIAVEDVLKLAGEIFHKYGQYEIF